MQLPYFLTREFWLVRHFNRLQSEVTEDNPRSTPGVDLKDGRTRGVLAAPTERGGNWKLTDDLEVKTKDIRELDTARVLAGYD